MEAGTADQETEPTKVMDAGDPAALRQGDLTAFRRLFDTYKDKVYSIAVYFLQGDTATAEDIAQEVFVRVYTRIGQFRCEADFATWLYRLVANACMDEFRRRKRRPGTADLEAASALTTDSPHEAYARLEIGAAVRAALSDLSPDMRLTVLLRYFEELSYEEIAAILHCSQGTVASRLNRSLKALARKLAPLRDEA
jgi:RNA polymerase sigma-70 factor (ECF subfamily)